MAGAEEVVVSATDLVVRFADMRRLGGPDGGAAGLESVARDADLERAPRMHDADFFRGRAGYQAEFLDDLPVPMPRNEGRWKGDEAPLVSGDGHELHYTNFSVVVSQTRRIALYAACNIDGGASKRIRRTPDVWYYDGRIALEHQVGEELYRDNELDRGHIVRREDPVWGRQSATANADSFHFTNCAPQHSGMNQRTWLGLEDYILKNSRVHELKVNVFTGPVLREEDQVYRELPIPREYWKVVVMRTEERPSATAYMISQGELIQDLEFTFGRYKTYQVAITEIESLTGLVFGDLRRFDGFSNDGELEGVRRRPRHVLASLDDIRV